MKHFALKPGFGFHETICVTDVPKSRVVQKFALKN